MNAEGDRDLRAVNPSVAMSYHLNSTCISRVSYDAFSGSLAVTFRQSGRTNTHHRVPADVFSGLLGASSHGAYYNRNIRGKYP